MNTHDDQRAPARLRSLRTLVTAWYGILIAACLITYSIAIGVSDARHLDAEWDRSVHEDIELATRALSIDSAGAPLWPPGFLRSHVSEEDGGGHWIEVWSPAGKLLLSAGTMDPGQSGPPDIALAGSPPHSIHLPTGRFHVGVEQIRVHESTFVVRAAISEIPGRRDLYSLWRELAALSLAVLTLGGLGSFLLVRHLLGPLARMAEHARRITAEQLHERLSLEDTGSELNQLRDAFNETLARLERSFERLRTFTADASHELRTPLTALRSVGEVSLGQDRSSEEYRETIGMMLEEADRLSRLVDDLLTLARADSSSPGRAAFDVDLSALAREVVDQLSILADEKGQKIETVAGSPVVVRGDRQSLRQALMNLVDNAIKYAPDGTLVRVAVGRSPDGAFLEVKDEGPGIDASHRDRIFERFYRVDRGRSREMGGTGLGLAIVKGTAEDHGGRVELESAEGNGSRFRIILP